MRRRAASLRRLGMCVVVFLLGALLVLAGSTSLWEPHHRTAAEDAVGPAGAPGAAPRRHPTSWTAPLPVTPSPRPTGGTALAARPGCVTAAPSGAGRATSATAGELQRGMEALASPDWQSADGGVSASLGDGRVVWLFGDTRREPGRRVGMVSNSMLVSTSGCFTQVGGAAAVIPDPVVPGERLARWPTAVVSIDRGSWSEVDVFTNTIRRTGGFWGFTLLGTSVTRFAVPDGGAPRRLETTALTADDDATDHLTWGTASVADDGWIYVCGTRLPHGSFGREVYVARSRPEDITNADLWQYHGSSGWGTRRQAVAIVPASPGTSHIISVLRRGADWFVVSKVGGDLGDDVGVWRASSPVGPYRLVSRTPRPYRVTGHQVRYMPLAHPEYGAGDTVTVSMSRNATQGHDVARNSALGRPEFFTLALP